PHRVSVLYTSRHCERRHGLGVCLSVPAKPLPELARHVVHQECILGRGRFGSAVSPVPLLHPDTIQLLDLYMVLTALHRARYDSPEFMQRQGDAYVERCSGLVHRSRPLSYRHRHRHASCLNFCCPSVGAWVDLAPQIMALVDTIPPPSPPEDTQHLAHEKIPSHE